MPHTHEGPPGPEVLAVRYGELTTHRSELFHDFAAYGEPDTDVTMDYYFWVIRDQGQTLLVDTGFRPEAAERRGRTCLLPPVRAMERLGLTGSVTRILVTHFHYDHIGNLDAFPNAEIVTSEREYHHWTAPGDAAHACSSVEPDEVALVERAHREGRVRLLPDEAEVMPGVTALTVGGHTPGQLVVHVEGARGAVILAADAVHLEEEFEKDRPFAVFTDLDEMYRAYQRLRDLSRTLDAPVVPGHDPLVASRHPAVSGPNGDIAWRLL